jgi:hypothetical protein
MRDKAFWGAAMKELVDQRTRETVDDGLVGCNPSLVGAPAARDQCDLETGSSCVCPAGSHQNAGRAPTADPLFELGPVLAAVAQRDSESAEAARVRAALERKFLDDFAKACMQEIRPAMSAVLIRLQQLGGDGIIEEHPGGEARFRKPRITLWMSLKDKIVGEPRLDRHPYLLFEADFESQRVQVDEGDMWRGAGGNFSGSVGVWDLTQLTHDRVTKELLSIAHRAAGERLSP